jgi:biopolymer transport protein ExbB
MAYSYYRSVTIDYTKCGTSNSTDFPVLVSFTDLNFRTVANGGRVQNASGYDIAFYSDSARTTPLFWEIDQYDASSGATGTCSFWVKVPTLSVTANTVIYVAYGDTSISSFQSTATSVWSNGFVGVWHLKNGTTLSGADSTTNANNGTITSVTATTGKIDGGMASTGTGGINVGNGTSLQITGDITLSAWVKQTSIPANGTMLIAKDKDTGGRAYTLSTQDTTPKAFFYVNGGASTDIINGSTILTVGNWYYIVGTRLNSTKALNIYLNGSTNATQKTGTVASIPSATANATLGYREYTGFNGNLNGSLDECRIANVVRDSSWIFAEYNNQNSPSTFFTLGTETPTTPTSSTSDFFQFF